MCNLKQLSIPVATIAATATVGVLGSIPAQAAIMSGSVRGIWEDGEGGFKAGDIFTAEYTYDSDNLIRTDNSGQPGYIRYLSDFVPLLSLVLNSGTVNYSFDLSDPISYSYIQWIAQSDRQSRYQYTNLYVYNYAAPGFNEFFVNDQVGRNADGTPVSNSYASTSSLDFGAGTTLFYGYTNFKVAFSQPHPFPPQPIPTPALLPGLVALGLRVLRKTAS